MLADRDLESQKLFLESIIMSSPAALIAIDLRKTIQVCNHAFEKLFGFVHEEVLGKNIDGIVAPDDLREEADKLTEDAFKEKYIHRELVRKRKDGSLIDVEIFTAPIIMNSVQVGVVVQYNDIRERKEKESELRQSEELFRSLWEHSTDGMRLMNQQGIVLSANGAYCQMMEAERAEIIGMPFSVVYEASTQSRQLSRARERAYTDKIQSWVERDLVLHNKRRITVQVSNAMVNTQQFGKAVLSVFRDVTEMRRAERVSLVHSTISKAIASSNSLQEFFKMAHEAIGTILDATNFFVGVYDRTNDRAEFPYVVDEKDTYPPLDLSKGDSMTSSVIHRGESLLVTQERFRELVDSGKLKMYGTMAGVWLGVPLKIHKNVVGIMAVQSYSNPTLYSEKDLSILESVSEPVALGILFDEQKKKLESV